MTRKNVSKGERGRWSAKAKRDAVLRLLRGQSFDTVSRELEVTAARLSHFDTVEELRKALEEWRRLYNSRWLIERHGHRPPAEVRSEHLDNARMEAA